MQSSLFISLGLPVAIAVIMCGIGLHLTPTDFRRLWAAPRPVLVGLLGHYLLLPALGFVCAWGFDLAPAYAVGLVLVAACPSATTSNTLTFLARGNVALAVSLSVISALVTFVSIPLLVGLATRLFVGEAQAVRVPFVATAEHLALILLGPIAAGMLIRRLWPRVAARIEPLVGRMAAGLLVLLVLGIMFSEREMLPGALREVGPAALTLCTAAIAGGALLGRLARLHWRDVLTVSLEVGVQNATLAMLLALTLFDSPEIALPGALYGGLMYLPASVVILLGRLRARRPDALPAAQSPPAAASSASG